jgi:hypothetical protein
LELAELVELELTELDELELAELVELELDEELLLELLELDEELLLELLLVSSSCRPQTQTLYVMSPPFAVSLILCEVVSTTSNPVESGWCLNRNPPPLKPPPVAAVCVPIGAHPFVASGSTSRVPATPTAFSFLILIETIDSISIASPSWSLPAPAPASSPA